MFFNILSLNFVLTFLGCCTFSTYTNTDFLSHLILKHALRDEFYCDLCSNKNDNKYVCSNPESFVKVSVRFICIRYLIDLKC